MHPGGGVCCTGLSILGQLNAHWHRVLVLIVVVFPLSLCLCTAGKPLTYMPYEMKLALDQEAHSGRPGSPYRLSPRELSKASPQLDPNAPNASRYSVPPGKSTHLHLLLLLPSLLVSFLPLLIQTSLAWLPLSLWCLTMEALEAIDWYSLDWNKCSILYFSHSFSLTCFNVYILLSCRLLW